MALPLANLLGTAALGAATPYLSKALRGIFGEDEATRERERALAETERVARGGTTQGQAGIAYARGRALSDLEAQASRGTAQQQAGLRREAMGRNVEAQTQYAAQLAELRSREQERARETAALLRAQKAREEGITARTAASKFAEGLLTPLSQQLALPDTNVAKKPAVRMEGATVSGTAPTAGGSASQAARRPGIRMGGTQVMTGAASENPMVAKMAPRSLAGGGLGLEITGKPQVPTEEASLASALAGAIQPALGTPAFVAPEPPAQSIYGGVSLGDLGAASGPDMAPAPIAMTGFGSYLNPVRPARRRTR